MCGLVGLATNNYNTAEFRMLETGLYLMQSRGTKGTGVAIIKDDKRAVIIKDGSMALDFIQKPKFRNLASLGGKIIVIGHTRAPVYGGAGKKCAHPFRVNNTILAHNGLLQNYIEAKAKYGLRTTTKNDTEALTVWLDKHGLKKMPEWEGTFALTFYYNKRLYLYKDTQGELFLTIIERENGKKTYFWASEWSAIRFILTQEKIDAPIYSIAPFKLWSLSLTNFPDVRIKKKRTALRTYEQWDDDNYNNNYNITNPNVRYSKVWAKEGDTLDFLKDRMYHRCDFCGNYTFRVTYCTKFDSWLCDGCMVIANNEDKESLKKNYGLKGVSTQTELPTMPDTDKEDGGCGG